MVGPDGLYVAAPTTFTSRTDASLWLDLQHADLVRGTWQAPMRPSASPSVTTFVEQWIEEHPTARGVHEGAVSGSAAHLHRPDPG